MNRSCFACSSCGITSNSPLLLAGCVLAAQLLRSCHQELRLHGQVEVWQPAVGAGRFRRVGGAAASLQLALKEVLVAAVRKEVAVVLVSPHAGETGAGGTSSLAGASASSSSPCVAPEPAVIPAASSAAAATATQTLRHLAQRRGRVVRRG